LAKLTFVIQAHNLPSKPHPMLSFHSKKVVFFIIAFLITSITLFVSCQKELTDPSINASLPPDLTTKVNVTVSGFVTDENDKPVANAAVKMANSSTSTDKYGFFEVKNTQVIKEAAFVTIEVPGYFKGIKSFMATERKETFFRIKMIPKINAGNIDAATGGNITTPTGLQILLPANGVVNATTNAAYTGPVNVAVHWLDPTAKDLNRSMPGDLRGLDTAGAMKLLTTYGMAAVALTGSAGESLQVAPGKKAKLTIPLPASIAATAPANIPLWYFDETTGLWKEEGIAVKSGNSYTGEVSHFSYWNCDVPSKFVRFNCTVTNAKGVPIKNALVKISEAGNPQRSGSGYTDSSGYTSGAVPDKTALLLEIFGESNCLSGILAQKFTTNSEDISLGKIILAPASSATITGSVNDCNNIAVTNGLVIMEKDGISFCQPLTNTGSFSFTTVICNSNTAITLIAEDKTAFKASDVFNTTLIPGENADATIMACNVNTQQFFNYSVNGTNYAYTFPADSLIEYAKPQNTPPAMIINAAKANNTQLASLYLDQTGISVNSLQSLVGFSCPQIVASSTFISPINVKITEYGIPQQFVAGNFSGTMRGPAPANITYTVTCNFRVRRTN